MEDKMKLVLQIKNQQPVELLDFSKSMIALGDEYKLYAEENEPEAKDATLYVKEIRQGCIIAELVAMAPYALQFVEHAETVQGYAEHIKKVIDIFLGRDKTPPAEVEKQTLENVSEIVNPVANDSGSQLNIAAINANRDVNLTFNLSDTEASAVQHRISKELERRKEPETGLHAEVLMYWAQARGKGRSGDRGVIESIHDRDVRVRLDDDLKKQMLTDLAYPFKHCFVVDVDVQTKEGKPALYIIKQLHEILDEEDT